MIITLAHSLGMNAIAEGVEIPNQLMHLGNLGCEAAQGYFFAKPLNCQTAESIIAKKTIVVTVGLVAVLGIQAVF